MPHHRKGPHGPPHRDRHGHGPEWLISVPDPSMPREQYADHLAALADALKAGAEIEINGTTIAVPATVEFVLRFERTPHGSMALVIRAEWFDDDTTHGRSVPAGGLVIGSVPSSTAG